MTIGMVAKHAAVGVETVRFCEREGLLEKPPRRDSGYREYPADAVNRVRFIKRAKELGFSLNEIRELLELRLAPGTTCGQVKKRAVEKIGDIEDRLISLRRMKQALEQLAAACSGEGAVGDCPILDALMEEEQR